MDSQVEKVLNYMRVNGSITNMDAYSQLNMTDLAQRIMDARNAGYNIETVMETSEKGKRYGRYFLHEESKQRA